MNLKEFIGKKVIVRCNRAGVFFGTLDGFDSTTREATISDTRRIWYWDGAASLSQLATDGTSKTDNCKFTVIVPKMIVMDVIEIIPCSKKAIKSIEEVKIWKC